MNISRSYITILSIFLAFTLSGCASLTHLTRTKSAPGGKMQTTYVDAKQRAVTSSVQINDKTGQLEHSYCAEPSPDALSAIAASQGISLSQEDIDLSVNNALGESAASIGLRTQSIQLMRDAMYRLCEAKMSGHIDDLAFETLHRRFQSSMVAILAIEQLTGAVKAPTVVLGNDAVAGSAELVVKYTDLTEAKRLEYQDAQLNTKKETEKLAQLEEEYSNEEKKHKAETSPEKDTISTEEQKLLQPFIEKRDTQKTKVSDAETSEANKKAAFDAVNKARLAALAGSASTTSSFAIDNLDYTAERSDATIEKVATTVDSIVRNTLSLSFSRELCTTILVAAAAGELDERNQKISPEDKSAFNQLNNDLNEERRRRAVSQARENSIKNQIHRLSSKKSFITGRSSVSEKDRKKIEELESELTQTQENIAISTSVIQSREKSINELFISPSQRGVSQVVDGCNDYLRTTVFALGEENQERLRVAQLRAKAVTKVVDRISADPDLLKDVEKIKILNELLKNIALATSLNQLGDIEDPTPLR